MAMIFAKFAIPENTVAIGLGNVGDRTAYLIKDTGNKRCSFVTTSRM